jgi:hypothetical protein
MESGERVEPKLLTCEQCGAPYLEGGTICYVCGAPLGEDERPTHPVRVPIHLRARVTQVLPAIRASPLDPPHRAASREGEAAGAPLPQPLLVAQPRGEGSALADRWRFALRQSLHIQPVQLALLGLSLVAFLAGIVVLYYRLIPPAVPTQAIYRDPHHRYHFARPALWRVTPTIDGVQMADSTGTSTVLITVSHTTPIPGDDVSSYADSLSESLGIEQAAPVVAAGVVWETSVGEVTDASGATHMVAAYVTLQRGLLYIVECSSPTSSFDTTNTLVFQPLLRSFAFD